MSTPVGFRFAGPEATDEQELLVRNWMGADTCFAVTASARWGLVGNGLEGLDSVLSSWKDHTATCHTCYENVLIRAQSYSDQFRRRVYTNAGVLILLDYLRAINGNYTIGGDRENPWVTIAYPPGESMIRGWEWYPPTRPGDRPTLVAVVADWSVMNEDRIVQEVDVVQVQHLQNFSQLGSQSVAWWPMVSERGVDAVVRCGSELKPFPHGAEILSRYGGLVRARWRTRDARRDGLSQGEVAEILERYLLKYDGTTWVRGFLDYRLVHRASDHDKQGWRAVPLTSQDRDGGNIDHREIQDRRAADSWAEDTSRQFREIEAREVRERVGAAIGRLPEPERTMVRLRLQGVKDAEIGRQLGLSRPWVNKRISAAKKLLRIDLERAGK